MSKRYTVSDGKSVLDIEEAEEGGRIVTSPLDPGLIAQAETLEEAFASARDTARALKRSRARLLRRLRPAAPISLPTRQGILARASATTQGPSPEREGIPTGGDPPSGNGTGSVRSHGTIPS